MNAAATKTRRAGDKRLVKVRACGSSDVCPASSAAGPAPPPATTSSSRAHAIRRRAVPAVVGWRRRCDIARHASRPDRRERCLANRSLPDVCCGGEWDSTRSGCTRGGWRWSLHLLRLASTSPHALSSPPLLLCVPSPAAARLPLVAAVVVVCLSRSRRRVAAVPPSLVRHRPLARPIATRRCRSTPSVSDEHRMRRGTRAMEGNTL